MTDVSFHESWQPASFPGAIVEDWVEAGKIAAGLELETRRVMSVDDERVGVFTAEWTPLPFWSQLAPPKRGPFAERMIAGKFRELIHLHHVSRTLRQEVRPWPDALMGWFAGISLAEDEPLMVMAEVRCGDGVMVTKHAVVATDPEDLESAREFVTTLRPTA